MKSLDELMSQSEEKAKKENLEIDKVQSEVVQNKDSNPIFAIVRLLYLIEKGIRYAIYNNQKQKRLRAKRRELWLWRRRKKSQLKRKYLDKIAVIKNEHTREQEEFLLVSDKESKREQQRLLKSILIQQKQLLNSEKEIYRQKQREINTESEQLLTNFTEKLKLEWQLEVIKLEVRYFQ